MSSQIDSEVVRLNKEIRQKRNKLRRLQNKALPLIWDRISIRRLRLEIIKIEKFSGQGDNKYIERLLLSYHAHL